MTDSCPEPLITHHHFHLAFCTKDHSLQGLGWFDNVRCWILSCSGPWLFVLPKDLVFYVTVQSVLNPAVSCDLCTNMKSKFYKSGLNLFTFAPNGLTQFLRSMKYCRNYTKHKETDKIKKETRGTLQSIESLEPTEVQKTTIICVTYRNFTYLISIQSLQTLSGLSIKLQVF